ncbi:MAG: hypothetical protein AAF915_15355 [Cyanobacteria bacterium P01_D01_bin.50]
MSGEASEGRYSINPGMHSFSDEENSAPSELFQSLYKESNSIWNIFLSDDHPPNCDAILLTVPHRYSCRRWRTRFGLIHMPYDFWSYKPTWAPTLSTTPRSSGHSPRRGRTELICSERQRGIAYGDPSGK